MSDLQPSHLPPAPEDALHTQIMRSSADEQNDEVLSADGSSARRLPWPSDDQSDRERPTTIRDRIRARWWNARMQGTLPLALSARIPLELFEIIVDEMNPPTLTAAALVCAAWYPRAMRTLYHTIDICSRASYNLLFKQCQASPRVKQWLASTCKLMVDEGEYIEDVTVFLQALPSALAGLMPRVRILHISTASLRFIRTDFFLALSRFESVKSLTLVYCRLNNVTQLRRIVSAFPQLTDLAMANVEFARRGAASHAGASPFRPPSHMRLRHLVVDVNNERMVTFFDWMTHSDLCTSLVDLTVRYYPVPSESMAQTHLNKLLEMAGASLTHFCEEYYGFYGTYRGGALTHGNLVQNTALQSLDFKLRDIKHTPEDEGPRAAWTEATDGLHGIFSTVRSRQLEHIEFNVVVDVDESILESEEPSADLEKLDLRDLYEVMSQPYFNILKDVEVEMRLELRTDQAKSDVDSIRQKLQAMFHGILQPWSARGIVAVTWVRI